MGGPHCKKSASTTCHSTMMEVEGSNKTVYSGGHYPGDTVFCSTLAGRLLPGTYKFYSARLNVCC